jgi:hypothetical protein
VNEEREMFVCTTLTAEAFRRRWESRMDLCSLMLSFFQSRPLQERRNRVETMYALLKANVMTASMAYAVVLQATSSTDRRS